MSLTAPEDIVKEFRDLWRKFELDAMTPGLEEQATTFASNVKAVFETLRTNHLSLFTLEGWQVAKLVNLHHYLGSFGLALRVKKIDAQDYLVGVTNLPANDEHNVTPTRQSKLAA